MKFLCREVESSTVASHLGATAAKQQTTDRFNNEQTGSFYWPLGQFVAVFVAPKVGILDKSSWVSSVFVVTKPGILQ